METHFATPQKADPQQLVQMVNSVNKNLILNSLLQIVDGCLAVLNEHLVFQGTIPLVKFRSNLALISRILTNMIINALEASQKEDTIKISTESDSQWIRFKVWNREEIGKDIAKRVFQRNFSTKETIGRGWGTYSMKLLGEKILNGKVEFTSSEKNGTTFQLSLPI